MGSSPESGESARARGARPRELSDEGRGDRPRQLSAEARGARCRPRELSAEARAERRRTQNREAAQRCRQRRRNASSTVLQNYQEMQSTNTKLKHEIRQLEAECQELSTAFNRHLPNCALVSNRHTPGISTSRHSLPISSIVSSQTEAAISRQNLAASSQVPSQTGLATNRHNQQASSAIFSPPRAVVGVPVRPSSPALSSGPTVVLSTGPAVAFPAGPTAAGRAIIQEILPIKSSMSDSVSHLNISKESLAMIANDPSSINVSSLSQALTSIQDRGLTPHPTRHQPNIFASPITLSVQNTISLPHSSESILPACTTPSNTSMPSSVIHLGTDNMAIRGCINNMATTGGINTMTSLVVDPIENSLAISADVTPITPGLYEELISILNYENNLQE